MTGIDDLYEMTTGRKPRNSDGKGKPTLRKSALLEQAWRYWTSQRVGTSLPLRAAMDPRAMSPILGHAMILDRIRPGIVRVRLGGHVLNRLMGMEVRGLPVRAFFDVADRARVMEQIENMFETPSTLEFDMISDGVDGIVTARMVVLPLLDSAGSITKALAVLVTDREASDPPRRFQLTHATSVPIVGLADAPDRALPRRRQSDHHLPVEIQAGMAENHTPFEAKPSAVPWLRIVK